MVGEHILIVRCPTCKAVPGQRCKGLAFPGLTVGHFARLVTYERWKEDLRPPKKEKK